MENGTSLSTLDELLTPSELARRLKTTAQTIGNWERAGIIPSEINCGRIIRYNLADVVAALKAAKKKEVAK